jgi:hypothetical protein
MSTKNLPGNKGRTARHLRTYCLENVETSTPQHHGPLRPVTRTELQEHSLMSLHFTACAITYVSQFSAQLKLVLPTTPSTTGTRVLINLLTQACVN